MCGLAGILRYAEDDDASLALARDLTDQLVGSIEDRGQHATGIAIHQSTDFENPFVWKIASKASVVRASDPWQRILDKKIDGATVGVQLHTRRASHNNASRDDCAHPFRIGEVVGCHNGIITNWREIETDLVQDKKIDASDLSWQVDSEAAFALLDVEGNPLHALDKIEGYFALSWTKGEHLYLARSSQGVLATAWVPEYKLFVWNSLGTNLNRVLKRNGLKPHEFAVRELPANRIMRINMAKFAIGKQAQKTLEATHAWGSSSITSRDAERWTGSTTRTSLPRDERPISLRDLEARIATLEMQTAADRLLIEELGKIVRVLKERQEGSRDTAQLGLM